MDYFIVVLVVTLGSIAVSILYVWLGIAYASTMMLLLSLLNYDLRYVLGSLLTAQVVTSCFGAYFRRGLVIDSRRGIKYSGIVGVSAAIAFLSALLLGVYVMDSLRLALNACLMLLAAITNYLARETSRHAKLSELISIGALTGLVKGVLGGSATPILIASHRLLGLNIDETMFRTLLSEVPICIAASTPYIAIGGFNITLFLSIMLGSVLGTYLGMHLLRTRSRGTRRKASSVAMIAASTLLLIEAIRKLHRT